MSGAMGDDDNAARRPSGGRAAGWGFAGHALVVIPISGASRPESILDSALAPELALSRDELAGLDAD